MSRKAILWLLLVAVALVSCKKPQDKLGPDAGAGTNPLQAAYVDTALSITVVRDTFFRSDRSLYGIVGSLWDPVFGLTTASLYTNFRLNQVYVGGVGPVNHVDSVILCLPYAGTRFYGSVSKFRGLQTFRVYELEDSLDFKPQGSRGYPYDTTLTLKPGLLAEVTIVPRVYDSVRIAGITEPPQLRLRLSNSLGWRLLTENPTALSDDQLFRQFFKGLYIQATPASGVGYGGFLFLNIPSQYSYLRVYFNDTSLFELGIRESNVWVNQFFHNFSFSELTFQNQQFAATTHAYLMPMGGCRLKLQWELPMVFRGKVPVAISRAEIIMPVDKERQGSRPLPQALGIVKIREDGTLAPLDDAAGQAVVIGALDMSRKQYVFNITNHVIRVKKGEIPNDPILLDYTEFKASRSDAVIFTGPALFPALQAPRLRIYYSHLP